MMVCRERYVIGVNGSFHDSAACLLSLDRPEIVAILSEDRHSGRPHHYGFPFFSLEHCISQSEGGEIVAVGYSRDKECFRRPHDDYFKDILEEAAEVELRNALVEIFDSAETDSKVAPAENKAAVNKAIKRASGGCSDHLALKKRVTYLLVKFTNELRVEGHISRLLPGVPILPVNHHRAHAAAYYGSVLDEATIITWDGRGEFDTTVLWHGQGERVTRKSTVTHPQSLGRFFEVMSEYVGFDRISGPGKLMGLAAYGDDRYVSLLRDAVRIDQAGFGFHFNPDLLDCSQDRPLVATDRLSALLGPANPRGGALTEREMAIAYAAQKIVEEIGCELVDRGCAATGSNNLVLSGGLALNCVMNDVIRERCAVDLFVLPACGDDGTALGAALALKHDPTCRVEPRRVPRTHYRIAPGPSAERDDIDSMLADLGLVWEDGSAERVADLLLEDKVIGVINNGYEYGPRALGFRSIIADARPAENWTRVNREVKFREDFRPFAPAMLMEEAERYWHEDGKPVPSPYMLLAPRTNNRAKEELGAVIHKDGTSRVQTVEPDANPFLHALLVAFKKRIGVGVVMNTSLNLSGESIISQPIDLLRLLAYSNLDAAWICGRLVEKRKNKKALDELVKGVDSRDVYLSQRWAAYNLYVSDKGFQSGFMDYDSYFKGLFD